MTDRLGFRLGRQAVALLALACLFVSWTAHSADTPERVYTHPLYGWSISYPADWKVDSTQPETVHLDRSGAAW